MCVCVGERVCHALAHVLKDSFVLDISSNGAVLSPSKISS